MLPRSWHDVECGAGRCCGRTRGTLGGAGPAARSGDVEAHDIQARDVQVHDIEARDVQARTPDRSSGPGAQGEVRAEVVGLRLELRRLCSDRQ